MITVSIDHFPFVLLDMGATPRTEQDILSLFTAFDEVAKRAERDATRYVILATTRDTMSAGERQMLAKNANRISRKTMDLCLAGICIFPRSTRLLRGVLTALSWLIPVVPPLLSVTTVKEGNDLAQAVLRKHSVRFPAEGPVACARWLDERVGDSKAPS